jgi:hypothetical protein
MFKLKLPTVQDLETLIIQEGQGCYLYSMDISRAYAQLRVDPLDWPLLGLRWNQELYFHLSVPFGCRTGSKFCMDTMEAVCFILKQLGDTWKVYVDDFIGLKKRLVDAHLAFQNGKQTLADLGIDRSVHKDSGPGTKLKWIGVVFDTVAMSISIPPEKLKDTLALVRDWLDKNQASKKMLQSILGKLFHISKCCKPARLFLNRMLDLLRAAPNKGYIRITSDFKKDLQWFSSFLAGYNGVYFMQPTRLSYILHVHQSLNMCAACFQGQTFSACIPIFAKKHLHCNEHRELCSILLATKLWGHLWKNGQVVMYIHDNPIRDLLETGRSRDPHSISIAREIWLYAAMKDFCIQTLESVEAWPVIGATLKLVEPHWFKLCSTL